MPLTGKIYFDNASTALPKAPNVGRDMCRFIEENGCNVNRGGYNAAYDTAEVVIETRQRLCRLFGYDKPHGVIFTSNITTSLNMVLKGFLKKGDHVITSSMEHNAVVRPLTQLAADGVEVSAVPCTRRGELVLDELEPLIRPNTRAVVMLHASNVCGTIMPVAQVGEICARHKLCFIVDTAQTAGVLPINMRDTRVDAMCFTGHKGLLAAQGIGGFIVTDDFAAKMTPLISGGTGSFSEAELMPELLPDRFEPGTINLPGIYGLNAALQYLEKTGIDVIYDHEKQLTALFLDEISRLENVRAVGLPTAEGRVGVVSLDFLNRDNAEISYRLASEYGILTRCGIQCAPHAHAVLGTRPQGTVRFSFGYRNTADEVKTSAAAIREILSSIPQ